MTKGADLAPIVVDRVPVTVVRDGKSKGGMIPSAHLAAMLQAETFLSKFPPVDLVTTVPMYLADFTLTIPGYNDGGDGHRILYLGDKPQVADSMDTINAFLDVMEWESNADRTNAVGAALTVMLRNPLAWWQAHRSRHGHEIPGGQGHHLGLRGWIGRVGEHQLPRDELGLGTVLCGGSQDGSRCGHDRGRKRPPGPPRQVHRLGLLGAVRHRS